MKAAWKTITLIAAIGLVVSGCSERRKAREQAQQTDQTAGSDQQASKPAAVQTINIAGSSTVAPITQAVAEEYEKKNPAKVTVAITGTGGGFKKFCRAETAISGASRPVKESERNDCQKAGVEFIELPVAYDGLAVVVSKENDWVDHLTVAELHLMWAPESKGKITKWSQIRKGWPDKEMHLFGPGTDSGTFDYFTQAINGKEQASRSDYQPNEDDNVLVQGVAGDKYALGYFGYAYYQENTDKLKVVPIDGGQGPIAPSVETVSNGTYQPLSRPIFIYVNAREAERAEVDTFVHFYLSNEGRKLVGEVGYIALPDNAYDLTIKRFEKRVKGSLFEGGSKVGVTVEQLLAGS